jgi:hypothetical protein
MNAFDGKIALAIESPQSVQAAIVVITTSMVKPAALKIKAAQWIKKWVLTLLNY